MGRLLFSVKITGHIACIISITHTYTAWCKHAS